MRDLHQRGVLRNAGLAVAVLLVLLAGACSGDDDSAIETNSTDPTQATATASVTPTSTASVEDEILADYMRYWDAYGEAALNLDASLVEEFAVGEELESIRAELADLRTQGVALRVVLTHRPVLVEVSGDKAVLMDEMVNNSFFVDPVTKEPPIASGSGETLRDTFYLERIDGKWVVTQSTRQR